MSDAVATNPFRPGNGHKPPHLAGRALETQEFEGLLQQDIILRNLIVSGLRGIGKTVFLDSLKPIAQKNKWLWAGTDCSESTSVNDETIALRILTDVALITSNIKIAEEKVELAGFRTTEPESKNVYLNFEFITKYYQNTPGFVSDKLKATLLYVWECLEFHDIRGIVFAYDEAQLLSDHIDEKQYPLSLLLDVFAYLQKRGVRFMLVLAGLPTLLTFLVNARTYSERSYHVRILGSLSPADSRDAIVTPITEMKNTRLMFDEDSIDLIIKNAGGYPYFIQFICREVFDIFEQQLIRNETPSVPIDAIIQKLDNDFFAMRWSRATEREKEAMTLVARSHKQEFSVQMIVKASQESPEIKPFSAPQVSQMLARLIEAELIFRNRRASYSFAVPLMDQYICRVTESAGV